MEKFHMYAQLYETEKRFYRACDQITHLNAKQQQLQTRYIKARDANDKCFRYNLRMRLLVVEGLLKRYCHYACMKKNEVLDLRLKLYGEDPVDSETFYSGEESDGNDDEDGIEWKLLETTIVRFDRKCQELITTPGCVIKRWNADKTTSGFSQMAYGKPSKHNYLERRYFSELSDLCCVLFIPNIPNII